MLYLRRNIARNISEQNVERILTGETIDFLENGHVQFTFRHLFYK